MTVQQNTYTYRPGVLIAGEFPVVTDSITVAQGQVLRKGAILGRNKAGLYVLSEAGATDGSKEPLVILADDVDASDSAQAVTCYLSGQFNSKSLHFGAGHTPDSVAHKLRVLNIYLTNTI